jgi:hypothetical protein
MWLFGCGAGGAGGGVAGVAFEGAEGRAFRSSRHKVTHEVAHEVAQILWRRWRSRCCFSRGRKEEPFVPKGIRSINNIGLV